MHWIILFLLSSCPLFAFFSFASTANEQTSSSEWIQQLHLSDCELPCWINIVPGETTLGEAQVQVETVYVDTSFYDVKRGSGYSYTVTHGPTGNQIGIVFRSDDGEVTQDDLVRTIYLYPLVDVEASIIYPAISDLQSVLGEPAAVRLASGVEIPTMVLLYRDQQVHINVDDLECDRVLPDQQILGIVLYGEVPSNLAWLSEPQEWVGYDYCYNFERVVS
jgi:hypothetical protein